MMLLIVACCTSAGPATATARNEDEGRTSIMQVRMYSLGSPDIRLEPGAAAAGGSHAYENRMANQAKMTRDN